MTEWCLYFCLYLPDKDSNLATKLYMDIAGIQRNVLRRSVGLGSEQGGHRFVKATHWKK